MPSVEEKIVYRISGMVSTSIQYALLMQFIKPLPKKTDELLLLTCHVTRLAGYSMSILLVDDRIPTQLEEFAFLFPWFITYAVNIKKVVSFGM